MSDRVSALLLERDPRDGRTLLDHLISAAWIIEYEARNGIGWWTGLATDAEKVRKAADARTGAVER